MLPSPLRTALLATAITMPLAACRHGAAARTTAPFPATPATAARTNASPATTASFPGCDGVPAPTTPVLDAQGRTIPRWRSAPDDPVVAEVDRMLATLNTLDRAAATNPDNYTVTSWHYVRTYRYGSPQLKADGTPGVDRLVPSSAYLSNDGRAVFVALPDIKPVMQMRVGWNLATADGAPMQDSGAFTPYELTRFDPLAEGFGRLTVDLTPRAAAAAASGPVSAAEGRLVYQRFGCVACHASEPGAVSRLGPNFHGLYGSDRTFNNGLVRVTADEAYLRESILAPSAKVVSGFNRTGMGMPSFSGVLTEAQIDSLILFIKSLREQ